MALERKLWMEILLMGRSSVHLVISFVWGNKWHSYEYMWTHGGGVNCMASCQWFRKKYKTENLGERDCKIKQITGSLRVGIKCKGLCMTPWCSQK